MPTVPDGGVPDGGLPGRRGRRAAAGALIAAAAVLLGGCSLPRWPVDAPITSPFGLRIPRFLPEIHHGVDLSVPDGTPVAAMSAGRVEHAGPMGGYGLAVVLRHGRNTVSLYAHLSAVHVRPDEEVRGRQIIGLSGRSGNARGPHLHFEVRRWGRAEDPVPLLGGPPAAARRRRSVR